jgi:hypothetical protein
MTLGVLIEFLLDSDCFPKAVWRLTDNGLPTEFHRHRFVLSLLTTGIGNRNQVKKGWNILGSCACAEKSVITD